MQGLPPDIARNLMLSVGTHRYGRPLSPVEVALAMQQSLDAGTKVEDLAYALHFDGPTMIRRFTRLLELPPQVQPLVGWGADASTLSFSAASELARLPGDEPSVAANAVLGYQLSLSEVRQLVQIRQRSGKPLDATIESVLRQRSVIVRRHVIVGVVTSNDVREQLRGKSQEERNTLIRNVLETHIPQTPSLGAKLGIDNFILVGDDRFQATVTALAGGFEQAIEKFIRLQLSSQG